VSQGWTKTELYLADLKAGTLPVRITEGKEALYSGDFLNGKIYITTNEDAPRTVFSSRMPPIPGARIGKRSSRRPRPC